MLVTVGIVLLFGTLGFAADTLFGHLIPKAAPVAAHSATLEASSVPGFLGDDLVAASRHMSMKLASVIGAAGGSYSALWFLGVAAAALCMFWTRP